MLVTVGSYDETATGVNNNANITPNAPGYDEDHLQGRKVDEQTTSQSKLLGDALRTTSTPGGLICYSCSSYYHKGCADPFNPEDLTHLSEMCYYGCMVNFLSLISL